MPRHKVIPFYRTVQLVGIGSPPWNSTGSLNKFLLQAQEELSETWFRASPIDRPVFLLLTDHIAVAQPSTRRTLYRSKRKIFDCQQLLVEAKKHTRNTVNSLHGTKYLPLILFHSSPGDISYLRQHSPWFGAIYLLADSTIQWSW